MRGSGRLHRWREGEDEQKKEMRKRARSEGMGEGLEELLVGPELEGDDEGCEEVESVLSREDWVRRALDDDEAASTLRKGLPRFVVFIMWEEVLGPSGEEDMARGPRDRMWKRG